MPESPAIIPLYAARVGDLRAGGYVFATCDECDNRGEVAIEVIKERFASNESVRWIGKRFRCTACGYRGASLNFRRALGHGR